MPVGFSHKVQPLHETVEDQGPKYKPSSSEPLS